MSSLLLGVGIGVLSTLVWMLVIQRDDKNEISPEAANYWVNVEWRYRREL